MSVRERIQYWLNSDIYTRVIIGINVFVVFVTIFLLRNDISNDHYTYLFYIKGIEKGRYTYWWYLKDYIPDTFRNPGYPYFLFLISRITESRWGFVVAQLLLYVMSILYLIKIIRILFPQTAKPIINIFLTILAYSIVIPYYVSLVFPEITMIFLVTISTYIYLTFDKKSWKGYVVLGLLFGLMFQFRPVVMLLPFIWVAYSIFIDKNRYVLKHVLLLVVYLLTMLPYGYWNCKTHKVFSVTPLEGGGGVLYLGYWSYKMPGYLETRYWRNIADRNIISFVNEEDIPKNVEAFEKEWDYIDSLCYPYLTDKDKYYYPIMMQEKGRIFFTYNGKYTYEREKLLKQLAVKHYLEDPVYTFKVKLFTFFRLWFAGIDKDVLKHQVTFTSFTTQLLPFLITFPVFILFLLLVPYSFITKKMDIKSVRILLLYMAYFGIMHLPFVLQSRYTIPVRPFMIVILSVSIYSILFKALKRSV